MEVSGLLAIAGIVFAYGIFSRYLGSKAITAPMVFLTVGWLVSKDGLSLLDIGFDNTGVRLLAEATLVVVLFADATRIDVVVLRSQFQMPGRLLGIGLPLTITAGGLVALLLIPGVSVAQAFLIGAILSPTDAALGKAVISNKLVPVRVRQILNVESGLNDGVALPVITVLLAVAAAEEGTQSASVWVEFAFRQIGLGVLFGVLVGYVGGAIVHAAWERDWVTGAARQLVTLSIAVIAFAATELEWIRGNGFIAAFVAGMAFRVATRQMHDTAADFTEDVGELATWMTFLFFGVGLVAPAITNATWHTVLYVVLSLTAIRMIPVALSLLGTHCAPSTAIFLGWFGPRGLASILFALLIVTEADIAASELILNTVSLTVLASVFLHGVTAKPGADLYVKDIAEMSADMPEMMDVVEVPESKRGGTFSWPRRSR